MTTTPIGGLDLSPDGLRIYLDDYARLVTATRTSRTGSFGLQTQVMGENAGFPSVSSDGLEVYYNGGGLIRRTRASTSAMFDGATATVIDEGGYDGDLTPDDQTLVYTGGNVTYISTRCP